MCAYIYIYTYVYFVNTNPWCLLLKCPLLVLPPYPPSRHRTSQDSSSEVSDWAAVKELELSYHSMDIHQIAWFPDFGISFKLSSLTATQKTPCYLVPAKQLEGKASSSAKKEWDLEIQDSGNGKAN